MLWEKMKKMNEMVSKKNDPCIIKLSCTKETWRRLKKVEEFENDEIEILRLKAG